MPPFEATLEPVALPDEAVRLVPSGDVYLVRAVEQAGKIGPVDYGSASAGGTATESGSSIINIDDELEMDGASLGQFWVNPLSNVEVEVRQQGEQDQRFVNSNQVGVITPNTPANERVVYVWEEHAPHFIITNPTTHDFQKTLIYYTGFILHVDPNPLRGDDIEQMGGTPATVPVDSLKRANFGGAR